MQAQALPQRASSAFHNQGLPRSALLSRCAGTGRRPVMLQQKPKRSLPRNLPWQATVGAAFCATVWLCARKRRSKSQRTKTKTRASTASPPTQVKLSYCCSRAKRAPLASRRQVLMFNTPHAAWQSVHKRHLSSTGRPRSTASTTVSASGG